MTDKSAAAVRKLAEKYKIGKYHLKDADTTMRSISFEVNDKFLSDLTALIEEFYYPKNMVRWTFNQRFMACGHTGFDSSILELDLEYWNEHIRGKENEQ